MDCCRHYLFLHFRGSSIFWICVGANKARCCNLGSEGVRGISIFGGMGG